MITFLLGGSQGDVTPFVALSKELVGRGHRIRFCAHPMFAPLAADGGALFYGLDKEAPLESLKVVYEKRQREGRLSVVKRLLQPAIPSAQFLTLLEEACLGVDLVVSNAPNATYAVHLAQRHHTPLVHVFFSPTYPTRHISIPFGPQGLWLGPIYNLASHHAISQLHHQSNRAWINRWRTEKLDLPRLSSFQSPRLAKHIRLFGFSPTLVPRLTDWPTENHITGFWPDQPSDWSAPPDLAAFVADNSPTIAVGFGSVMAPTMGAILRTVVEAVRQLRVRAVLIGGWGANEPAESSSRDLFFIDQVPYAWLFPRVSAVIHASGCGTVAEVLRAARPSVAVPFAGEQRFFAHRLWKMGVVPKPLSSNHLETAALARSLDTVLSGNDYRKQTRVVAEIVKQENGVACAAALIDQLLA
jgi:UDP:flavonoid glycosyltransferase YjiC (YdhE family)